MCRKYYALGVVLLACGITLLISMILPRCFWTALIALVLIVLGCLFCKK